MVLREFVNPLEFAVFLHTFDLKCDQSPNNKVNLIKQITQPFHFFIEQIDSN